MENHLFVSVMTPATSSGSISFTLETFDAVPNVTLVMEVTGISAGESEISIASKVNNQLTTIIAQNDIDYQGSPVYAPQPIPPYLRLTRTEHCIDFFSQCSFSITASGNVGAIVDVQPNPSYVTVQEAKNMGVFYGQDFLDEFDTVMSDTQITSYISLVSANVASIMRSFVIQSTHVQEIICNWTESVKLIYSPIIKVDSPYVRRPSIYAIETDPEIDVTSKYFFSVRDGWVLYRYAQNILEDFADPFQRNNIFYLSYIAGARSIPQDLKAAVVKLSTLTDVNPGDEQLSGGTFSVKTTNNLNQTYAMYLANLTKYMV